MSKSKGFFFTSIMTSISSFAVGLGVTLALSSTAPYYNNVSPEPGVQPVFSQADVRQDAAKLVLSKTEGFNRFGNPVYALSVVSGGRTVRTFPTVTGRAHTQNRDRHRAGTEAPLPTGLYRVGPIHRGPFGEYELGRDYFIDLFPTFQTGRSELGIHFDPSFNKDPKEDGTAGCIGLASNEDLRELVSLVRQYNVRTLEVN